MHSWMEYVKFKKSGGSGKAHCEQGWNWCPPPLTDYDLWYALSGEGEMRINEESYPIRKGSCFLVRPGDRPYATQHPDNRLRVIFIHFRFEQKANLPLDIHIPHRYAFVEESYFFETLLHRILEIEQRIELWKEEEFDCILRQLFLHLYRSQLEKANGKSVEERHRNVISRVIAVLKETPGSRVSREELAAAVELSPDYLSKIFKLYMGVSLKEYMTDVRLERAMILLQETSMNVSQVAEVLGYANIYLFSKQFKMKYGNPPSYYKLKMIPSVPHGKHRQ